MEDHAANLNALCRASGSRSDLPDTPTGIMSGALSDFEGVSEGAFFTSSSGSDSDCFTVWLVKLLGELMARVRSKSKLSGH